MPSKAPAGGVLLSHTHRFVVVALAVWVVMALVVPVAADAGTGRGPAASGAGVPQITWAACGPQLECARVPVPLDWAHPNGPTIALAVARHLASHPEQRIGSLFVNPGGPGDSGVGYVGERGQALDAMTGGRFDIVGWDLRGGAGASAPVRCFASADERASFWHEAAGPGRCALAGRGPVAPRVNQLLNRLRQAPIPAPSADPPGELTYGEALSALKLAALPDPSLWPVAAAALEAAIQGDASVAETIARGATTDQVRMLFQEQGTALVCADSPRRQPIPMA